jgi:hypothetical protein
VDREVNGRLADTHNDDVRAHSAVWVSICAWTAVITGTYVKFGKGTALGLPVVGSACAASSLALRCIERMHVDVDDDEEMTETREIERPLINRLPESIVAHTTLSIKTQLTASE